MIKKWPDIRFKREEVIVVAKRVSALALILALISGSFFAASLVPNQVFADTTLTSCNTLSTPGETYILQNDVNSGTSDCFIIQANGITIEGQGHSITGHINGSGDPGFTFTINNANIFGNVSSDGSFTSTNGGNAGTITITNSVINGYVSASGGAGAAGSNGVSAGDPGTNAFNAGNGGTITISNSSTTAAYVTGGSGGNGGNGLYGTVGSLDSGGGYGGNGVIGGDGGNGGNGGNGGTIDVTASSVSILNASGGNSGSGGNGGAGGDGGNSTTLNGADGQPGAPGAPGSNCDPSSYCDGGGGSPGSDGGAGENALNAGNGGNGGNGGSGGDRGAIGSGGTITIYNSYVTNTNVLKGNPGSEGAGGAYGQGGQSIPGVGGAGGPGGQGGPGGSAGCSYDPDTGNSSCGLTGSSGQNGNTGQSGTNGYPGVNGSQGFGGQTGAFSGIDGIDGVLDITNPPVITYPAAAPHADKANATITWTTDINSDSQVQYGLTTAYGSTTVLDSNQVTIHSVEISGLLPNTVYHFKVISQSGGSGLVASTTDDIFITNYIGQIGTPGSGDGQFTGPSSIVFDNSGNYYVADSVLSRIQEFNASGNFIRKWGTSGSGNGEFSGFIHLAIGPSGNIYVSDYGNSRVQVFSPTGTFIRKWGSYGSSGGEFANPIGIAVDSSERVYVANSSNNRVDRFTSTGGSPEFLISSNGSGDGQFSVGPQLPYIDSNGRLFVSDPGNHRIQKFDLSGNFLAKFTQEQAQLEDPASTVTDSSGNIYIISNGSQDSHVSILDASGNFISKFGDAGLGEGQFNYGLGITIGPSGVLYLTDYQGGRIQMYETSFTDYGSDTVDPTVNITSHTNSDFVSGASVTLTAEASDDMAVTSLQFYRDNNVSIGANGTSTSPYSVTWDSTAVSDGAHTIYAVARDFAGNIATSTISVTVDNTLPVISSIASSTTQTTATITWDTDEDTNASVLYGTVSGNYPFDNGSLVLEGSHNISLTGLTAGTKYYFIASSTDAAGNRTISAEKTFYTSTTPSAPTQTVDPQLNPQAATAVSGGGGGYVSVNVYVPENPNPPPPSKPVVSYPAPSTTVQKDAQVKEFFNGYQFPRAINVGYSDGKDIQKLQQFLNKEGFIIATTGAGSPGKETTTFGTKTKAALILFQKARGIQPPSGFFGALTRAFVNKILK